MHAGAEGILRLLALSGIAAAIGGLAALDRKGAGQLMLSRPLALAPLLGWALGDAASGLMLGVPLELLFLGGVNLGGSLPENETLLAAALTSALVPAGLARGGTDAALAALGLVLLYPLALLGRRLDRSSERRNDALLEAAVARAREGDPDGAALNLRGLWIPFASTAAICAACVLLSPLLAALRAACGPRAVVGLEGAWHAASALAVACAVRGIRDRRAPALAAAVALGLGAVALFRGRL